MKGLIEMKDEKILQDELMSDEELDKVAGGGYTPEEVLKKYGDLIKNMGKPIGEMIELFGGGKTSKS